MNWILWKLRKLLTDKQVTKIYKEVGCCFGDAVSYVAIAGLCVGFKKRELQHKQWETEYVRRGYKLVPMESFVSAGGYGENIDHLFLRKAECTTKP